MALGLADFAGVDKTRPRSYMSQRFQKARKGRISGLCLADMPQAPPAAPAMSNKDLSNGDCCAEADIRFRQ
jgi:hypothetical protein